jgi:hypothetical protein
VKAFEALDVKAIHFVNNGQADQTQTRHEAKEKRDYPGYLRHRGVELSVHRETYELHHDCKEAAGKHEHSVMIAESPEEAERREEVLAAEGCGAGKPHIAKQQHEGSPTQHKQSFGGSEVKSVFFPFKHF